MVAKPLAFGYKPRMTPSEALRLAQFIKDHDKRFEAKAKTEGAESFVLLTSAVDSMELEPIYQIAQYHNAYIVREDPGPTVRAAWEQWQPQKDF